VRETYGSELVMDLRDADPTTFTRATIQRFFADVCERLGLEPCDVHFWDYQDPADRASAPEHLRGVTAVQFITTSSLVIHTLDVPRLVCLTFFTCGDMVDARAVGALAVEAFGGSVDWSSTHGRGWR
jgi:S-adenosylmethionine/arginine decarboxylase-like enzyme